LAPALVALLETPFQYEVMNTLAAIGPGAAGEVAALAVPVLERLRFDGPEQASLKYRQGRALTKLRGK
jgi:hypothetical protein